jgi:MarR family 2-MHQ and catechol resistance regulon transcriptional repressor
MSDGWTADVRGLTEPPQERQTVITDPNEAWDDGAIAAYGLLREAAAEIENVMRMTLKRSGLPFPMFELLLRLARSPQDRLRLTTLAIELTVTTGGVTRLVDRAELQGLVRREPCVDDARGYHAVITSEGKRRLREAMPMHLEDVHDLWINQLGPDRDAVLARVRKARDHARHATTIRLRAEE